MYMTNTQNDEQLTYEFFKGKRFEANYISPQDFNGLGKGLTIEKLVEAMLESAYRNRGKYEGEFDVYYDGELVLRVKNSVWVFALGDMAFERTFLYALHRAIVRRKLGSVEVLDHVI